MQMQHPEYIKIFLKMKNKYNAAYHEEDLRQMGPIPGDVCKRLDLGPELNTKKFIACQNLSGQSGLQSAKDDF